jgi:hypothetical protein
LARADSSREQRRHRRREPPLPMTGKACGYVTAIATEAATTAAAGRVAQDKRSGSPSSGAVAPKRLPQNLQHAGHAEKILGAHLVMQLRSCPPKAFLAELAWEFCIVGWCTVGVPVLDRNSEK